MMGFPTAPASIVLLLNFGIAQCQHLRDVEPANKAFFARAKRNRSSTASFKDGSHEHLRLGSETETRKETM